MSFLNALLHHDFLRNALLAALLVSLVCAVLGTYTVIRRSSYMVGAVSHALLGGIGLARYCQAVLGIAVLTPFAGSVLASLVVSVTITACAARTNYREDTLLSAIWTVGIALGLCFIALIPGYAEDLNAYLFGNILLISRGDLLAMAVLDLVVLLLARLYHNRFMALFFNSELLVLHGISLFRTTLLLNILTGLAVVLLSQAVGVVLALALMTLPPATALLITRRFSRTLPLAALLCFAECAAGIVISYHTDIAAGAAVILLAAGIYLLTFAGKKLLDCGNAVRTQKLP